MPTIKLLKDKHTKLVEEYEHDDESQYFYNTRLWRDIRMVYKIEHPLCEECLANGIVKETEHIHHKIPFLTGNTQAERWRLFTDENNLQALCKECHKAKHEHRK